MIVFPGTIVSVGTIITTKVLGERAMQKLEKDRSNLRTVQLARLGSIVAGASKILILCGFAATVDATTWSFSEISVVPIAGDDTANINNAITNVLLSGGGRVKLVASPQNRIFQISGQLRRPRDVHGYEAALKIPKEIRRVINGEPHVTDVSNRYIEIAGEGGAVLEVQNWATAISIFNHTGTVAIRNLTVRESDKSPSHVGGTVIEDEVNYFRVHLDDAYRNLEYIQSRPLDIVYDYTNSNQPGHGYPAENGNFYRRAGRSEGCWHESHRRKVLRCNKKAPGYRPGVNKDVVVTFRKNGHDAIYVVNSGRIEISGVTVMSAPGMALTVINSGSVSATDFNVEPYSQRWQSVSAAATHFRSNRGGVWFDRVNFRNFGDDGFNFHNLLLKVFETEKLPGHSNGQYRHRVRLTRWQSELRRDVPASEVKAGDYLRIGQSHDPFDGNQQVKVETVKRERSGTLVAEVVGMNPTISRGNSVSNLTVNPYVAIHNCVVRRNRGRGLLISALNTEVNNCQFERNSGPAILITADSNAFGSGRVPKYVTIKNSTISHSNLGANRRWAMLEIGGDLKYQRSYSTSRFNSLERVVIENNTFTGPGNERRIMVSTTNQNAVTLRNNRFNYDNNCPVLMRDSTERPECRRF